LPAGKVLSITGDRAGHIWIGGEGGLSQFAGGHFITLTRENGLPGNSVSAVLEDDDGSLWIAGELGIIRVRPQELQTAFQSRSHRMQRLFLDTTDGLPGLPQQEEPFPTATKSADGRLWFTTTDGIAAIDPRRIPMNTVPPPVVIQTVTADKRKFTIAPELHFPPKVRNLEIGFAALSFSIPERVLCRYKLEGYDTDWHSPGGLRLAIYTNLPPRQYQFRVAGCNDDGICNEAGAMLQFDIAPMFYQTNCFLLLCGLATVFLLWLLYRWRLRFVTARLDLRHAERLSERERIARELHDTLLQSFHGVMFRFQSARNMLPRRTEEAMEALDEALERTEDAIAEGRDTIRDLRSSTVVTNELAQALTALGAEMSHEPCSQDPAHGSARFHVVVEGPLRDLHPILRDEVYAIAREAVRNAFRHAQARNIEADIRYYEGSFRLRIRDDGKGIDPRIVAEGRPGHYGVSGMRERARRIGGKLHAWTATGAGTEIELSIPGSIAYGTSPGRTVLGLFRKKAARTHD
jgi:signal transduction histidine kinase